MSDTNNNQNINDIILDDLEISQNYGDDKKEVEENKKEVDENNDDNNNIVISKSKLLLVRKILANIKTSNDQLLKLLSATIGPENEEQISIAQVGENIFNLNNEDSVIDDGRIIEGIFDGESMIGPDGKQYSVPANYASKSKLIEGDSLKLTITNKGTFVYKQIKPIERRRIIGHLGQESNGNYAVIAENNKWHVLTASVTYYKGQAGDEIVIIVPVKGKSKWAAVDNIVKNAV